jgi:hypothetical protein
MKSRIQCFFCAPADEVARNLRRYAVMGSCSGPCGYHNAVTWIENLPAAGNVMADGCLSFSRMVEEPDPRWPVKCDYCNYRFSPEDARQTNLEWIYLRMDTGETFRLCDAKPGAMWYADWGTHKGPDGRCLAVNLPPDGKHVWLMDNPASNSDMPWRRSGTVPRITANPSILTPNYHGFLRGGWLEEC